MYYKKAEYIYGIKKEILHFITFKFENSVSS